ncbi:MAG: UDP-glucose 4-epimerase GalE [Burkholderiaceae bacterium]|jgi:UDP-glucose 4-epimerase
MKILVTGCAGYIGGTFAYEALKKGYKVIGLDNFSHSNKKNINHIKKTFPKNFTFFEIDLLDDNLIKKFKKHTDINSVLHFAALKSVPESEKTPDLYIKNNVEGTKKLLSLMQTLSIKRIIFSSSAAVYGNQKIQPIKETATLNPKSVYAKTKKLSEDLIEKHAQIHSLKAISLRYFNPIGTHEDYLITDNYEGINGNIMAMLIRVATGSEKKLYIYGDDYPTADGTGERDYIHINDIVDGHFRALEKVELIDEYEVYNLGTGSYASVLELIKTLENVNGLKIDCKITSRRAGDLARSYADPSKANAELNWRARYNLETMCKDAWEAIKNGVN